MKRLQVGRDIPAIIASSSPSSTLPFVIRRCNVGQTCPNVCMCVCEAAIEQFGGYRAFSVDLEIRAQSSPKLWNSLRRIHPRFETTVENSLKLWNSLPRIIPGFRMHYPELFQDLEFTA